MKKIFGKYFLSRSEMVLIVACLRQLVYMYSDSHCKDHVPGVGKSIYEICEFADKICKL